MLTAERPRTSRGFHTLTVASVDRLTSDAVAVTFDVPADLRERFAHAAGQSLTLRRVVDGVEHRRPYSLCSAAGDPPRIGVREIPGGLFSRWLVHEVRPGDTVEARPPTGGMRASAEVGQRHLCLAAGSGITPLLSIATTVLRHPGSGVTLLYGNRTTGSVMFAEELADLKNRYGPRLDLVHVLSREPRDVDLFSGRLDADRIRRILDLLVPVAQLDHVWICGPLGMVEDARRVLAELGVPPQRVHVELFFVDGADGADGPGGAEGSGTPPPLLRRPDPASPEQAGPTSEVTVVLDGRSTTVPMARTRTVLDSAQAVRSDLPFACRGGVCGTCRAQVRDGEVDLVRNYALEESELADGYVLTCQSYPVSPRVTVDYDA